MPIHQLAPSTASRITSTQALSSPLAITKELLDNALDARATSISIEIACNTLDVIQVRDNGHGIAPEDRALLAIKHCTSKLRDFQELRFLGGASLGFRGEALSSVADAAGHFAVTTRVEGETAAVKLEIGRDGQVTRRERASHPVGTTVRAANVFRNFPVREQVNLKAAAKTLAAIKRMLQAYALARPGVRIALKVLRAKSETGNLLYAPKAGDTATVEDAVGKILGRHVTNQCEWTGLEGDGFEIRTFLPRADAEVAKIAGMGQFVSVDSRPVSAARGVLKQVVAMYKEALRKSCVKMEGVKNPFMFFNVICPPGAYDPNVEPAKDDVLFDDGEKVTKLMERQLEAFYPKVQEQIEDSIVGTDMNGDILRESPGWIDIAEEESPHAEASSDTVDSSMIEDHELAFLERRQPAPAFRNNMYGRDDEDMDLAFEEDFRPSTSDRQELSEAAKDVNISNPWTIARMAGSRRTTNLSAPAHGSKQPPLISSNEHTPRLADSNTLSDIPDGAIIPRPEIAEDLVRIKDFAPGSSFVQRSQFTPINQLLTPPASSSPVYGTPLDAIPDVSGPKRPRRERRQENANRPFVNPVQTQNRRDLNWFDFSRLESSQRGQRPRPPEERPGRDIRDFMVPNCLRNTTPLITQGEIEQPIASTPYSNSAPTPQSGAETMNETETSVLSFQATQEQFALETQPGAFQRRQSKNVCRTKSSYLPLESIPDGARTHNLQLVLRLESADVSRYMATFRESSSALNWTILPDPPASLLSHLPEPEEIGAWCKRLTGYLRVEFEA